MYRLGAGLASRDKFRTSMHSEYLGAKGPPGEGFVWGEPSRLSSLKQKYEPTFLASIRTSFPRLVHATAHQLISGMHDRGICAVGSNFSSENDKRGVDFTATACSDKRTLFFEPSLHKYGNQKAGSVPGLGSINSFTSFEGLRLAPGLH